MGKNNEATAPKFCGYVRSPSGQNGVAFVYRNSIAQISGPKFELPANIDLMLHVNENHGLGDPTLGDVWITFFVERSLRTKSKVLVFGAQYDTASPSTSPEG